MPRVRILALRTRLGTKEEVSAVFEGEVRELVLPAGTGKVDTDVVARRGCLAVDQESAAKRERRAALLRKERLERGQLFIRQKTPDSGHKNGGTQLLCTPNCATVGTLNDRVLSLVFRPNS